MERVKVLIVSYGAREAAILDTLCRSDKYHVVPIVIDKQANPLNLRWAKEREGVHIVDPKLNTDTILEVLEKYQSEISYGLCPNEGPIVNSLRDEAEMSGIKVPLLFPTREYALEKSKVEQRKLLDHICPDANPEFKVFYPKDYENDSGKLRDDVVAWVNELGGVDGAVVKPDEPGFGKGVGVGGEHFSTIDELFSHASSLYELTTPEGTVRKPFIIEERLDGEESSFQAYCDGNRLAILPETRDHKRAFDDDIGPNTGGMGSYMDNKPWLPFMTQGDREKEEEMGKTIHEYLKGGGRNPNLLGMPYYIAFIHTIDEPKILEINSREGDPEIINVLTVMKNDLVDLHFDMINGNLKNIEVEKTASVVTYKVPPNYGGFEKSFPEHVKSGEVGKPVDLNNAYKLSEDLNGVIMIYPGSMELKDGNTYALRSRTVASVGIGDDIQSARDLSLTGLNAIKGGSLWHRTDIGSREHIGRSIKHMENLVRSS